MFLDLGVELGEGRLPERFVEAALGVGGHVEPAGDAVDGDAEVAVAALEGGGEALGLGHLGVGERLLAGELLESLHPELVRGAQLVARLAELLHVGGELRGVPARPGEPVYQERGGSRDGEEHDRDRKRQEGGRGRVREQVAGGHGLGRKAEGDVGGGRCRGGGGPEPLLCSGSLPQLGYAESVLPGRYSGSCRKNRSSQDSC